MKPLQTIYWLRLGLGIIAAFICMGYGLATGSIRSNVFTFTTFMNSMSIALITYLISYYIMKRKFMLKVEKPQKIVTMGIGIYFVAWIVFWVLLYSIIAGPPPPV